VNCRSFSPNAVWVKREERRTRKKRYSKQTSGTECIGTRKYEGDADADDAEHREDRIPILKIFRDETLVASRYLFRLLGALDAHDH
jgi:hypothetical protein